jgi:hypothetical protein
MDLAMLTKQLEAVVTKRLRQNSDSGQLCGLRRNLANSAQNEVSPQHRSAGTGTTRLLRSGSRSELKNEAHDAHQTSRIDIFRGRRGS